MFLQSSSYYPILCVGLPVWFWPVSQECEFIVALILSFCSNTTSGAGILPGMQYALSKHLLIGGKWIFTHTLSPAQHFQPERGQQGQVKGRRIQPGQPRSHCPATSRSQMANSVPWDLVDFLSVPLLNFLLQCGSYYWTCIPKHSRR